MANTYLTRTASGTDGTNSQRKNTVSMWLKRSSLSDACFIEGQGNDANATQAYFDSNANLTINHVSGNSSLNFQIVTNRKFRDTSAWYHFVITIDTTLGTAADRVKIYVNGVRETSFSSASYPGQNATTQLLARLNLNIIGRRKSGGVGLYFDGSMSHVHVTDGTVYQASTFGSTDSTTGEWKINTSPSVTYGNNGFFILKDGNTITDSSTNSNNFSLSGGAITNTKDCPSNVFATLNPLIKFNSSYSAALSNGNTTLSTSTGDTNSNATPTTLGITTGKYYWETKFVSLASGTAYALTGIMAQNPAGQGNYLGGYNDSYGYGSWNGVFYNNGGSTGNTTGGATYTTGDIIGMAFDADNNRLYYYKNGTIQNSGTGIVIPAASTTVLGAWFPAVGDWGSTTHVWSCNFGNGFFGTTAITTNSGNGYAGAEGASKFNYQPKSGHSALSTKGLNT